MDLMHSKGNHQKKKKRKKRQLVEQEKIFANDTTDKGFISKIYTAHTTQYLKNKQPNKKVGGRPKQTFHQRRHTDGHQTHEKALSIVNYQRNSNKNYNEVSPHTSQNDYHENIYK